MVFVKTYLCFVEVDYDNSSHWHTCSGRPTKNFEDCGKKIRRNKVHSFQASYPQDNK